MADAVLSSRPTPRTYGPAAGLILPVTALLLWEVLARAGVVPRNWLPAPSIVASEIAAILMFAVLGKLSDRGLEWLSRRLQPWRER